MEVTGASLQPFCLPLQRPLTTEQGESYRHGILLRLHGRIEDQEASAIGIGEASPLPGAAQSSRMSRTRPASFHILVVGSQKCMDRLQ